jgi:tRNA (cmo5U34)-methyltransferase
MAPARHPPRNPRREFDREARHYDRTASATMPRYAELHRMLAWGVPHLPTRPLRILELGPGTGTLTELLLESFPHAQVEGVDLSPAMVTLARRKLARFRARVTLRVGELDALPGETKYDVIVSCLAIHHLVEERKRRLFRRVYEALTPGGYFGDGDDHLPEDSRFDERFSALASSLSRPQPRTGRRERDVLQKVWHAHEYFDHPVPLSQEVQWLREAGFVHLDTPWRFFNQAVVWAYR